MERKEKWFLEEMENTEFRTKPRRQEATARLLMLILQMKVTEDNRKPETNLEEWQKDGWLWQDVE